MFNSLCALKFGVCLRLPVPVQAQAQALTVTLTATACCCCNGEPHWQAQAGSDRAGNSCYYIVRNSYQWLLAVRGRTSSGLMRWGKTPPS
eukprot:613858-Rhodomonas_salina.1